VFTDRYISGVATNYAEVESSASSGKSEVVIPHPRARSLQEHIHMA